MKVLNQRNVRNSYEHVDSRLDDLIRAGVEPEYPRVYGAAKDLPPAGSYLLHLDSSTGVLHIGGDQVDLANLMNAMKDLNAKSDRWMYDVHRPAAAARPRSDPYRPVIPGSSTAGHAARDSTAGRA